MKAINVKYHGATATLPARLSAFDGDNRVYCSTGNFDRTEDAYANAARTLAEKFGWKGRLVGGHTKTGMVFVFDPDAIFSKWDKLEVIT